MAECIAYVIDYSENEDFRKKCFELLRHKLEEKILSNSKCDISFVLASIGHEKFEVSNVLNYPGMFERILFGDGHSVRISFEVGQSTFLHLIDFQTEKV